MGRSSQAVAEDSGEVAPKRRRRKTVEEVVVPEVAEPTTDMRGRRPMSDLHKAALAEGRDQGRSVRYYLEALEQMTPRRGRRRTQESIEKRLATIEETFGSADALTRLHLAQERMDLEAELANGLGGPVDISELEDQFVAAVRPYSERKGISYAVWREMGVKPEVLRRGGMTRG